MDHYTQQRTLSEEKGSDQVEFTGGALPHRRQQELPTVPFQAPKELPLDMNLERQNKISRIYFLTYKLG